MLSSISSRPFTRMSRAPNSSRASRDHADHPHSLCAHPFEGRNVKTVASVIGDLDACELHVAKGSPCRAPYATYTLATCQTGALSVTVADPFVAAS